MSAQEQERDPNQLTQSEFIDGMFDRATDELHLLAAFYHRRGYTERAKEIYQAILKARKDRGAE